MFYNTASHLLFHSLFHDLDNSISHVCACKSIALSPWQAESITLNKYAAILTLKKISSQQYHVIITTDSESIFEAIKGYIKKQSLSISLRLSIISRKKLHVSFHDHVQSENIQHSIYISLTAIIRNHTQHHDESFTIYIPPEFFSLFKIKINNLAIHNSLNDIESKFVKFFNDPYNLFPSLAIILETMDDNEFQKLIYFLLNDNILTPYHLYLLTRAFPQHALKIKHNISSNLISDILHIGKTTQHITGRDVIEGIYAFEEILYLKLRTKPYFRFGNFIEQINKILHHINILYTFQQKTFDTWFDEIKQSGLLYTILSQCNDVTIAAAFCTTTHLFKQLSHYLSARRLDSISSQFEKSFTLEHMITAQYSLVQLYLKSISHLHTLYSIPFNRLLKKYINPQVMYYVLLELGWFTIATAFKQIPKKLVLDSIQKFPKGAQYCILDVYDGVLNPNILHDEMQIKKARHLLIESIIKLHFNGTINLEV